MLTVEETNRQASILAQAVKERRNIVWLSRFLGKSIAETSRFLNQMARTNEKFRKLCHKLNWPLSISTGHIYLGSPILAECPNFEREKLVLKTRDILNRAKKVRAKYRGPFLKYARKLIEKYSPMPKILGGSTNLGERQSLLKPGDHVTIQNLPHSRYCAIYKVIYQTLYEVEIGIIENDKFKRIRTEWFSKDKIKQGYVGDFARANNCTRWKPTKKHKIVYKRGKDLGTTELKNVVAVNYDWK
jgi:hypothetical protein